MELDIASSFADFMSDYGMPVGMGAQALGTMMRKRGLDRVRDEQAARLNAERMRQREIQARLDAEQARLLPQFTKEASEAQRQSIAKEYEQYMQPTMAVTDAGEYGAGVANAPAEVKARAERELADARKKNKQQVSATANLQSYGGLNSAQRGTINASAVEQSRLKDASRGWSGILPAQLAGAHSKGADLMAASDIANSLGSLSFMLGATTPRRPRPAVPVVPGTGLRLSEDAREPGLNPRVRGSPGLRLS